MIFGVRHFHEYLIGRRFTLVPDHKPLVRILGSKQGIPILAAARLQRWGLILSAYEYDLEYIKGEENKEVDLLSRLPIQVHMLWTQIRKYIGWSTVITYQYLLQR